MGFNRKKEDYSRETAIARNREWKERNRDNIEYQKELKRLIREKHKLGNTDKKY